MEGDCCIFVLNNVCFPHNSINSIDEQRMNHRVGSVSSFIFGDLTPNKSRLIMYGTYRLLKASHTECGLGRVCVPLGCPNKFLTRSLLTIFLGFSPASSVSVLHP